MLQRQSVPIVGDLGTILQPAYVARFLAPMRGGTSVPWPGCGPVVPPSFVRGLPKCRWQHNDERDGE